MSELKCPMCKGVGKIGIPGKVCAVCGGAGLDELNRSAPSAEHLVTARGLYFDPEDAARLDYETAGEPTTGAEQQQQEPVGMVRLVTYEGVAKNSVEWEAVLSEEVKFNRDRFKDGEPLYTHQQPQAQGENEKIKSALNGALAEIKILSAENAELRARRFARFNNEECWIYQGNGEDYLESLVCPVVISAAQLIEILKPRAAVPDDLMELLKRTYQFTKYYSGMNVEEISKQLLRWIATAPTQPGDVQGGEG